MIITTQELFAKQYRNGNLQRYDIVVRYIAAENFLMHKKLHRLYEIDCKKRMEYVCSQECVGINEGKKRFENTISSFMKNKEFDIDNPIIVYTNYNIQDGIHRLAICLYLKIKKIAIKFSVGDPFLNYPDKNYYKKAFNENQFCLLLKKEKEILNGK